MSKLVERRIGLPFQYLAESGHAKTLIAWPAKETALCDGCYFKTATALQCKGEERQIGNCEAEVRSDHKDVIFKEVLSTQFELMRLLIVTGAKQWVEDHPQRGKFWMGVYITAKNLLPREMMIIRNSPANILSHKDNLLPFWRKLKELINNRMKPITVKDFIDYLSCLPPDYELHCFNDGEPIQFKDSETDHQEKRVILEFE